MVERLGLLHKRNTVAFLALPALLLLVVACGSEATATAPAAPASAPTLTATATALAASATAPPFTAVPTAAPTPTPPPTAATKNKIVIASSKEINNANLWASKIAQGLEVAAIRDVLADPLNWQDSQTHEIVPTGITVGWAQVAPDRWRYQLRPGVKFHNGEPWNAAAAAYGLTILGDKNVGTASYDYTGALTGEVVDDLTLDVVCSKPCPILPRTTFFTHFQAPEWWKKASDTDRSKTTIGTGPYKLVEWRPGEFLRETAYKDYVPVPGVPEMQKPKIQEIVWVWRTEATVRAAMVKAGEADLSIDIGVDSAGQAPAVRFGGTTEVVGLFMDTIWHPELKKKQVREAVVHAINCKTIIDRLLAGQTVCRGNIVYPGVLGATEANTKPYEYNPDLSKQLLRDAGYDSKNTITIMTRSARLPKQLEVVEAVQGYLQAVGITTKINVLEGQQWTDVFTCGIGRNGASMEHPAPGCTPADMGDIIPSNETLDFAINAVKYMDCTYQNSKVCDQRIQPLVGRAGTLTGDERKVQLEKLATFVHDEFLVVPLYDSTLVYAVNPNLVWEPRNDRRVRVSTMYFR